MYQRNPLREQISTCHVHTGNAIIYRTDEGTDQEGDKTVRTGTQTTSKEKSQPVAIITASLRYTESNLASPPHRDTMRPNELLDWREKRRKDHLLDLKKNSESKVGARNADNGGERRSPIKTEHQ